jgi:anti-anti-sigma regulatory factor
MASIPDPPYEVSKVDEGRHVVRFAKICDHERTVYRDELQSLIYTGNQIVCDMAQTTSIVSSWIRMLEQLSVAAEQSGKRFVIAAMSESVKRSADEIGVGSQLIYVESVEQGWK